MKSIIVMTVIGSVPRHWQPRFDNFFPTPAGFSWRFVPEGPFPIQSRSILKMDARAVAVWIGEDDAVSRAVVLINRLLQAGLPVVIAVAEVHDPESESLLREAGALYFCASEAERQIGAVLEAILRPPSFSICTKMSEPAGDIRLDAS